MPVADTGRLDRRVANLKRHFGEAQADMDQIGITAQHCLKVGKFVRR